MDSIELTKLAFSSDAAFSEYWCSVIAKGAVCDGGGDLRRRLLVVSTPGLAGLFTISGALSTSSVSKLLSTDTAATEVFRGNLTSFWTISASSNGYNSMADAS